MKNTNKNVKLQNGTIISLAKCDELWLNEYELNGRDAMTEDGGFYLTEKTMIYPDGRMEGGY